MTFPGYRAQARFNHLVERLAKISGSQLTLIAPFKETGPETQAAEDLLLGLALAAAERARKFDVPLLASRCVTRSQREFALQWPGEHYRLIGPIALEIEASIVVEVGTHTGMGSVALLEGAERVITYDIEDWSSFGETVLRDGDFASGRVQQRIGDLADPAFFKAELELLSQAQLVFIDGPKDRRFEPAFTRHLIDNLSGSGIVLVFDDIRLANMVGFWDRLTLPKIDMTSLGHWSGTGIARL